MCFYYLYFRKACVCYQRAFDLNNTDTEVGISLSQVLKDLGRDV